MKLHAPNKALRAISKTSMTRDASLWAATVAAAALLPLVANTPYFLNICVLFGLYAAINLMWVLVLGTAGIFSFATLGIVGASAYVGAYISIKAGWTWPAVMAISGVVGALLGAIVAAPAIRLRGVYFALVTFGLVELFRSFVVEDARFGQGQGLYGADGFVPSRLIGTQDAGYIGYYAALALVLVALVVYWLVDHHRLGLLLRTSRESELFADALGIGTVLARVGVFMISSAMLGVVGGFYVAFYRGVSPGIFNFSTLLLLFAMIVVGGLGSARGVLLGTGLLLFVDQHYSSAGAYRLIAEGAVMLAVTLFTQRGLAGIPVQARDWWKARQAQTASQFSEQSLLEQK